MLCSPNFSAICSIRDLFRRIARISSRSADAPRSACWARRSPRRTRAAGEMRGPGVGAGGGEEEMETTGGAFPRSSRALDSPREIEVPLYLAGRRGGGGKQAFERPPLFLQLGKHSGALEQ